MQLALPGCPHLTYFTNVHAGESWAEIRAALPVHVAHLQEVFKGFDARALDELECLLRRLRDVLNPAAASASAPSPEPG